MNLLYFGSSSRQLFGAYHAPGSGVAGRGAALLCAPWGQEYLISHRTLRRVAERLSEIGYHVLRFDYYGTGDSAGEREEGDLDSWLRDAETALIELRDMSGFQTVTTFGLRLGAFVAWRLAMQRSDVHASVLWDPVVYGADYVRDLMAVQAESDQWMLAAHRRDTSLDESIDLLGFPLASTMRHSIEQLVPSAYGVPTKTRLHLLYSEAAPEQDALHAVLAGAGTAYKTETIQGQTAWRSEEFTTVGTLPVRVLEHVVELLR